MIRQCKMGKKCKICNKPHATVLHLDSSKSPKDGQQVGNEEDCRATNSCVSVCQINDSGTATSSLIVPVWLYHQGDPRKRIEVYAVLEDQSDTCFVTEDTCARLGVEGPDITLELGTMHTVDKIQTQKITGLTVARQDSQIEIELPKCYTRKLIPAQREQIPRQETAQKWKHLRAIANRIPPYRDDLHIGILIGNNCTQAIKPRDVVPGRATDPYAIRTALGWGVIGAILPQNTTSRSTASISFNRIVTKEIGPDEPSAIGFVVPMHYKEIMTLNAVGKMFERDFFEKQSHERAMSVEDRRFLRKLQDGIHQTQDGHYEMPLPFRDDVVKLPSNRKLAENRLQQLKRKFERNPKFQEDYVTFMNDTIEKGYAEKAFEKNEMAWYIPHHGVYHPKKMDKNRVVFDCSAEFQGCSLNKNLLQGPDLTNSLVGVLCRFRQEPIAFACDIEGMFLQVRVNEEHRDYLRFLWWENGNTNNEPQEYRMKVHLSGPGSSPGCANLALKATAEDNEQDLGLESANFLKRNFYVDDGLKSVETTDAAITLIKRSKEMCAKGGFHLHKFISNRKEVIESIPPEDRAKGIKNLDLDRDDLPPERVL